MSKKIPFDKLSPELQARIRAENPGAFHGPDLPVTVETPARRWELSAGQKEFYLWLSLVLGIIGFLLIMWCNERAWEIAGLICLAFCCGRVVRARIDRPGSEAMKATNGQLICPHCGTAIGDTGPANFHVCDCGKILKHWVTIGGGQGSAHDWRIATAHDLMLATQREIFQINLAMAELSLTE